MTGGVACEMVGLFVVAVEVAWKVTGLAEEQLVRSSTASKQTPPPPATGDRWARRGRRRKKSMSFTSFLCVLNAHFPKYYTHLLKES